MEFARRNDLLPQMPAHLLLERRVRIRHKSVKQVICGVFHVFAGDSNRANSGRQSLFLLSFLFRNDLLLSANRRDSRRFISRTRAGRVTFPKMSKTFQLPVPGEASPGVEKSLGEAAAS